MSLQFFLIEGIFPISHFLSASKLTLPGREKGMTNFSTEPISEIQIRDESADQLPLSHFHLVIVVEPDPERYYLRPEDEEALDTVLDHLTESLALELDPETLPGRPGDLETADQTRLAWISYEAEDYFIDYFEEVRMNIYFPVKDPADTEAIQDYLKGAAANHPGWRTAVIGAMYEDDVLRIAGLVQEAGLDTTVLTRYCLSSKNFLDLTTLPEEERKDLLQNWEEDLDDDWDEEF
jgi:hypothetical protein